MKKQRIEKRPTRLRRAVKSVVIMLCVLLICQTFGGGSLTRKMAIRSGEERYGVYEKTHEIASLPAENIYRTLCVTLMAGENTTYCGASHFYTLLGWQESFGAALDCSDGASAHAGWWDMRRDGEKAIFYWGRIDDASVTGAEIEKYRAAAWNENEEKYVFEKCASIPVELIEDGGYQYFLAGGAAEENNYGDYTWDRLDLVCYDASGEEVLRCEIDRQISTSFG